jgi:hypothetical protein
MKRLRDPRWFLILVFLAIIAAVPLIQALSELRAEEDLHALEIFNQAPTAANLRNYERSIEAANWLGRLTRPWVHFFQFQFLKDGAEKVVIGKNGWYFYKPGLQYMLSRPLHESAKRATNDPIAAIVDFRDQLAARGIRLLLLPVPNKESIYPDYLTRRSADLANVLAPRTRHFLHELARADIEFVDLFGVFSEARKTDSSSNHSLYLAQDTHWSPAGVDLAAKVVARRLTTLGWVEQGTINYVERPAPVRRLGDILRMLKVPAIEARISPETVNCAQVVRADTNEPYKDAGGTEILVLGDSFLRIYQQDDPKAAGFIAHLAKEMKQPLLSLVNNGGGATLVREELRAQPAFLKNKKVVIWEFVERDLGLALKGWPRIALPAEPSSSPHPD